MKKWLYSLAGIALIWWLFPGVIEFVLTLFLCLVVLVILFLKWLHADDYKQGKKEVKKLVTVADYSDPKNVKYWQEYQTELVDIRSCYECGEELKPGEYEICDYCQYGEVR